MKKQEEKLSVLEDSTIIDLYWQRNESAIPETDRKYGRYLYTIAYNILHDSRDCEECLDDTYFSTWNRIPPTKPTIFQIFLSKITRNVAVDTYRKNRAEKRIPSEMINSLDELGECIPHPFSVEDEIHIRQISFVLNDYLATLSKKQITIFVCRYYYCDSIEQIAQMMNVNPSTVYRQLTKIKDGLKQKLDAEGVPNG